MKLRTLLAGPGGYVQPGEVVDMPEPDARRLIATGAAEAVADEPATEPAVRVSQLGRQPAGNWRWSK